MRTRSIILFTIVMLSSGAERTVAQPNASVILTGRVSDRETGTPLVGAHVFIATSMMGTTTNQDGRYRLERVPTGAHRLYVSMLGFESEFKDVMLRTSRVYPFDFTLQPTILEAGEITVEAERDEHWLSRLERFTRMFMGETPNAAETTILNPEVLDFDVKSGTLYARASEPLEIENRALGYRIKYFLANFEQDLTRTRYDGEPLYEEMEEDSTGQSEIWQKNRKKAFLGSFRHFLLALLAGRSEGQGFKTYSRPDLNTLPGDTFQGSIPMGKQRYPLDPAKLFKPGESSTEFVMDFDGYVEIIYRGETEDPAFFEWQKRGRQQAKFQTSWIRLERGPVIIDYKGDILDPYGVTFFGYLAFERVADEVPKEFRPGR